MKYMGSKRRIAKHILPLMLKDRGSRVWVEPFVGGGNTIERVSGERTGSDINPWLIDALVAIRDNVERLPKSNLEFTEQDYAKLRSSDSYKYKGYAGFAFSYGGKWLGGWCRDGAGVRDYVAESYRNAVSQSKLLRGVQFRRCGYQRLNVPPNSLVYCDPPYQDTTSYTDSVNPVRFWQWCRQLAKKGCLVFVSEYVAPNDFECVWQMPLNSSLTKDTGCQVSVEKLFRIGG